MKNVHRHSRDVTLPSGQVLADADFDRMADAAEATPFDIDRLARTSRRRGGRPPLGDGPSTVLQVRLDAGLRAKLDERAEHEHRTPSSIAREAISAFLDSP
jgi:hypothetical protein